MKERKNKRKETRRDSIPGREMKVGRGSCTQKSPFMAGKSAGAERDLWGIGGEHSNRSVEGRTK